MNEIIEYVMNYPKKGLKYKQVFLDYEQVTIFSDGSIRSNEDRSFQVVYRIFLTDKHINANLMESPRIKLRLILRSVIGAKTLN